MIAALLALAVQEIRATPEGEKVIRVVAEGRFETAFTKRKGFGSTWFDLKRDPEKKRDLAPVLDENGFFWVKIGKPGTDGSWYANPAEEMTLLEPGPARVRVRLRGAHMRYGNTDAKAAWPELRFDHVYTLYPDGSVYLSYGLETEAPVPIHHFLVITKSNGSWGPKGSGEARIAGENGAEKPTSKSPTSFTLQWSDGPTWFTDILMVPQKGKFGASYWNEGYLDKDLRCSFDLAPLWPDRTISAGKQRLNFLVRFGDDINSAEAAALHAADYRSPDRLDVTKGTAEGYDEGEGCYVLQASPEGVAFTIHGKTTPRVNPAFKVKGWTGSGSPTVSIGEKRVACASATRDGMLIVQMLTVLREDAGVVIRP